MARTLLSAADRQAAWDRCREWQDKVVSPEKNLEKFAKEENHDHELNNFKNHDHDQKKASVMAEKSQANSHDGKTLFRIVNQDPDFKLAISWGLWPQALFNACKEYGLTRVRQAIHVVKDYTGVRNKAAYCMTVIKNPPVQVMKGSV